MEAVEMEQEEQGQKLQVTKREEKNLTALYVTSLQTFETCGYFDASFKRRYPTRENPSKVVTLGDGRTSKIVPTQEYGYPNAVDLDYKRALFRLIDEQARTVERINSDGTKSYHHQVVQPLRAQTKPFIRYAGRSPHPRERKILNDFLHRNAATRMHGEFEDPKTRQFKRADVALFSQVITKGENTTDGIDSEHHLIWLTPFALRLYYWHRTRPEDITFHNQLANPISKVLCPYLDSGWFASYSNGGKAYTKSYLTLCHFLSIPPYKYLARIRQQLDPTHEELKALGYLDRWEYRQRPNGEWVVTWYPGWKWFEDAKARGYEFVPKQLDTTKPPAANEQQPPPNTDADELLRHFYKIFHDIEKPTPAPKETAQAASLIEQHGLEKARYVVEFSHRVAPKTNYQPRTFSGIVHYEAEAIADYENHQKIEEHRQQEHAQQLEQERSEAEAAQQAEALLAQLPPEDYQRLYAETQAELFASNPIARKNPDGVITRSLIKQALYQRLNAARSIVS
jgi:hypothetical protein